MKYVMAFCIVCIICLFCFCLYNKSMSDSLGFDFVIKVIQDEHDSKYATVWIICSCESVLGGTFISPNYWFVCSECEKVWTNTDYVNVDEFYEGSQ